MSDTLASPPDGLRQANATVALRDSLRSAGLVDFLFAGVWAMIAAMAWFNAETASAFSSLYGDPTPLRTASILLWVYAGGSALLGLAALAVPSLAVFWLVARWEGLGAALVLAVVIVVTGSGRSAPGSGWLGFWIIFMGLRCRDLVRAARGFREELAGDAPLGPALDWRRETAQAARQAATAGAENARRVGLFAVLFESEFAVVVDGSGGVNAFPRSATELSVDREPKNRGTGAVKLASDGCLSVVLPATAEDLAALRRYFGGGSPADG